MPLGWVPPLPHGPRLRQRTLDINPIQKGPLHGASVTSLDFWMLAKAIGEL